MKRLEVISRTDAVTPALQARLADPLWMIGRQWQLGELTGEDAASPVMCRGRIEHAPAVRLRSESGATTELTAATPLEALVEREVTPFGSDGVRTRGDVPIHPGERDAALRRSAIAGRWLLRAVQEALQAKPQGLPPGPQPLRDLLAREPALFMAAFMAATRHVGPLPDDPAARLLVRTCPSGARAAALLRNATTASALLAAIGHAAPDLQPAQAAARATLATIATPAVVRWLRGLDASFLAPDARTWIAEDAAYRFRLDIGAAGPGPTLAAHDHRGGRLDWHSVRVPDDDPYVVRGPSNPLYRSVQALPRAVRYDGMPAPRFWAFEDARVDFGGWRGDPRETVRWLLAELAVVYGDDWFVVPVALPYGHLCRVDSLVVHDCFGGSEPVSSFAAADREPRDWRFFELTGDTGPSKGRSPWLWLAPVLPDRQEGEPVEELRLLRDESLDMAWGVEQRVEGPDGRSRPRAGRAEPPADGAPGTWTYHLAPQFPPGWTPLLLEERTANGQTRRYLRRGRLPGWTADDLPRGRLLDAAAPLSLTEAIVPPGGLVLTRSPQRTRGPDGRVWTWVGREVRPGAGEAATNLQFDRLERK